MEGSRERGKNEGALLGDSHKTERSTLLVLAKSRGGCVFDADKGKSGLLFTSHQWSPAYSEHLSTSA
jgi:hypothetical protein